MIDLSMLKFPLRADGDNIFNSQDDLVGWVTLSDRTDSENADAMFAAELVRLANLAHEAELILQKTNCTETPKPSVPSDVEALAEKLYITIIGGGEEVPKSELPNVLNACFDRATEFFAERDGRRRNKANE